MKKLILIILLMLSVFSMQGQTSTLQGEDPKVVEMRESIGIDYSIPDFKTKKVDVKVIGSHLAGMLQLLQKYYMDGTYNSKLGAIVKEQKGLYTQVAVEKLKITQVEKKGDIITVSMNTKLSKNNEGIQNAAIIISFDKGVSDSQQANSLFSYLSRYVK